MLTPNAIVVSLTCKEKGSKLRSENDWLGKPNIYNIPNQKQQKPSSVNLCSDFLVLIYFKASQNVIIKKSRQCILAWFEISFYKISKSDTLNFVGRLYPSGVNFSFSPINLIEELLFDLNNLLFVVLI